MSMSNGSARNLRKDKPREKTTSPRHGTHGAPCGRLKAPQGQNPQNPPRDRQAIPEPPPIRRAARKDRLKGFPMLPHIMAAIAATFAASDFATFPCLPAPDIGHLAAIRPKPFPAVYSLTVRLPPGSPGTASISREYPMPSKRVGMRFDPRSRGPDGPAKLISAIQALTSAPMRDAILRYKARCRTLESAITQRSPR
jgi:hypothetical protein